MTYGWARGPKISARMRHSFAGLEAFIIDERPDSGQGHFGGADGNKNRSRPRLAKGQAKPPPREPRPGAKELDFNHLAIKV
jgi:hypothetical protein